MCLIINTNDECNIPKAFFKDVWSINSDGWGVLWHAKGGLRVKKGMDFNSFYQLYSSLQANGVKEILIHFRMATQGDVCMDLAHPFLVHDSGIWMLHNGIVDYPDKHTMTDGGLSDTALFAQRFVKPLLASVKNPSEFIRSDEFEYLFEKVAGTGNRFTFSDKQGHVLLSKHRWVTTTNDLTVSNTYAFSVYNPVKEFGMYRGIWPDTSGVIGYV